MLPKRLKFSGLRPFREARCCLLRCNPYGHLLFEITFFDFNVNIQINIYSIYNGRAYISLSKITFMFLLHNALQGFESEKYSQAIPYHHFQGGHIKRPSIL